MPRRSAQGHGGLHDRRGPVRSHERRPRQAPADAHAARRDAPEYAANYYEHVEFILRPLMKRIIDRGSDPPSPARCSRRWSALAAKFKFERLRR
jgi:hypothetical protein